MIIFEKKKLERDMFRKLRDKSSLNQKENVEKNVKKYVDSFVTQICFLGVSRFVLFDQNVSLIYGYVSFVS